MEDVLPKGLLRVVHAKDGKSRVVPVSRKVMKAIRVYVRSERADCDLPHLLLSRQQEPLTRSGLLTLIKSLSSSAGTPAYSPHAFRRGFVVTYLVREGDPFSAKRILGRTTMAMVDRYAAMGVEDLKAIHRRASPVAHEDDSASSSRRSTAASSRRRWGCWMTSRCSGPTTAFAPR